MIDFDWLSYARMAKSSFCDWSVVMTGPNRTAEQLHGVPTDRFLLKIGRESCWASLSFVSMYIALLPVSFCGSVQKMVLKINTEEIVIKVLNEICVHAQ